MTKTQPPNNNGRRSGTDRRQYNYAISIPEKRTGIDKRLNLERRHEKDRRKLADRRTAVYRSWYSKPERRSLKFRRSDIDRRNS